MARPCGWQRMDKGWRICRVGGKKCAKHDCLVGKNDCEVLTKMDQSDNIKHPFENETKATTFLHSKGSFSKYNASQRKAVPKFHNDKWSMKSS